jgi:hypothetical protein
MDRNHIAIQVDYVPRGESDTITIDEVDQIGVRFGLKVEVVHASNGPAGWPELRLTGSVENVSRFMLAGRYAWDQVLLIVEPVA